jgi:hypothetical protein
VSGHPRCGIYASVRNRDPVLTHADGTVNAENARKLAEWDDVVADLGPMVEQPQIAAALRAANPGIRLHAYVVMKAYNWPGAFFQEMLRTVTALDGYLYATDGSMWRDSNINTARPDVVDAVARVIAEYLGYPTADADRSTALRGDRRDSGSGKVSASVTPSPDQTGGGGSEIVSATSPPLFDGLFLDVFCPGMPNATASGVDWRRAGFDTEQAFQDAWWLGHSTLVALIRHYAARSDLLITGNCGPGSHADVNGWMASVSDFTRSGPVRVVDTRPGENGNALLQVETADAAHLDVEQQAPPPVLAQRSQEILGAVEQRRAESLEPEQQGQGIAYGCVVVHDKNGLINGCHHQSLQK